MIVFLLVVAVIVCILLVNIPEPSPCCGDCTHYRECWSSHVEYMEQNTVEHPVCERFKA